MRTVVAILGLSALFVTTGCRSPYVTLSDITIQLPAPKRGELLNYHILRTNLVSSVNMIQVRVEGYVNQLGLVELPEGSSVLEAIVQAGGFSEGADFRRIYLTQREHKYLFVLRQENEWHTLRCFAWYAPGSKNYRTGILETTNARGDFVLKGEARIQVLHLPFVFGY